MIKLETCKWFIGKPLLDYKIFKKLKVVTCRDTAARWFHWLCPFIRHWFESHHEAKKIVSCRVFIIWGNCCGIYPIKPHYFFLRNIKEHLSIVHKIKKMYLTRLRPSNQGPKFELALNKVEPEPSTGAGGQGRWCKKARLGLKVL